MKKYRSVTDPKYKRTDGSTYEKPKVLGQKVTTHIWEKNEVVMTVGSKPDLLKVEDGREVKKSNAKKGS